MGRGIIVTGVLVASAVWAAPAADAPTAMEPAAFNAARVEDGDAAAAGHPGAAAATPSAPKGACPDTTKESQAKDAQSKDAAKSDDKNSDDKKSDDKKSDDKKSDDGTGGSGDDKGTGGAGSAAADQLANQKRGLDALGVPLVSYNTDLGFGFGAVGGGYYYSPGYTPYRHAVAAQIFLTTRGIQNHWIRYDGPSLIGGARLEIRGEYRRELYAPFYGVGNQSPAASNLEPSKQNLINSFDYFFPGGWVRVRGEPWKGHKAFDVFGGYAYHRVRVNPYANSSLETLSPNGVQGGSHGQLFAGALWDTRDNESDPKKGGVQEIAVRFSNGATISNYNYTGLTFADRHFFSLGSPKWIFAERAMVDALFGNAPFFEWSQFGGTMGGEGIGGMSSVRGVPRNRYQGKVKAVLNTELRFYPLEYQLFGEATHFGGVAFFDTGRVWQENTEDGPWWLWHSGVGTGLRITRRAAVLRGDVAVSTETWKPAIYITFGHMF